MNKVYSFSSSQTISLLQENIRGSESEASATTRHVSMPLLMSLIGKVFGLILSWVIYLPRGLSLCLGPHAKCAVTLPAMYQSQCKVLILSFEFGNPANCIVDWIDSNILYTVAKPARFAYDQPIFAVWSHFSPDSRGLNNGPYIPCIKDIIIELLSFIFTVD